MKIINIAEKSWTSNCYALISDTHAIIVDPSVSCDAILGVLEKEGAKLCGIILTHGHFDHIMSLDTLRQKTGAPAMIHELDDEMLTDGHKNAFLDFFGVDKQFSPAERLLRDGDVIELGDEKITVIHTPGHTKGSSCFLTGDALITGDTVFADGYGRCDLYGGDIMKMRGSLKRLRDLEPSLTIYPGHGAENRLGAALDNTAYLI